MFGYFVYSTFDFDALSICIKVIKRRKEYFKFTFYVTDSKYTTVLKVKSSIVH